MNFENEIIKHTIKDGIEYLQFKDLLKYPQINHAYILKTNNMNFRMREDNSQLEQTINNLKVVCTNCDFKFETIVRADYNHTSNVKRVDEVDLSKEIPELHGERFNKTDGLITDKKDITIMATNADCLLILVFDPIKEVIGIIHAGWRGTFGKIILNAIDKMKEEYRCNPKDIKVYFSPSIRKCHFEVDEDVRSLCEETFSYTNRLDEIITIGDIKDQKQKYMIDNILINKILLKEVGVLEENIIDSGICSVCNKEYIHSRRAEGPDFGLGGFFVAKRS